MSGQNLRVVAGWLRLRHRDLSTTMIYTEQQTLDLIRATEAAVPNVLAREEHITLRS